MSTRHAGSGGAREQRSRALQPKQIPPAHQMAIRASTKAIEQEAAKESSVRSQRGATAHSKQDDNTLPLSSSGRKGKFSTVSKSSKDKEEQESEGGSIEDGEVKGKSERSDKDPLAALNETDEEPFTEDDELEDDLPPRGKWPTVKFASFLCLPDFHEKLVIVVPGIGAAAARRLFKRVTDIVCYEIYSYFTWSFLCFE